VTLLPRHAPSALGGKVSPMCPEYRVTYLSGRTRGSTIRLFVASVPTIRPFRRTTRLGSRAPIMPAPMARATEFPPPVPRCDRSGSRSRLASPVGLRHEDGTARRLVVLLLCRDSVPPIVIPYSISSCWGATRSRVVPYELARASGLTGAHLESPSGRT